ncbi:MAG: thermonuclease family protein [Planctomycetota bacterium]|nr:thermonuclease family protein [Planctomycetota bacterium]MDA1161939.1 thermonuclease family protein [Planctomycetota bacterium]
MAGKNRRKRRLPRSVVVILGIVIFLLQHFGVWDRIQNQIDAVIPTQTVTEDNGTWRVIRVVDGDTLVLQNDERVRLIGVDTPETKHPTKPVEPFGPEASSFTKRAVEGKVVQLQFDREKRDRYQRLLAYVYVGDWCLNEELIRAGYSECITRYPFDKSMKARFRLAEGEARNSRRGLWSVHTTIASKP